MLNFIGIGHSHIVALAKGSYALEAKQEQIAGQTLHGRFHYLYDAAYMPAFLDPAQTALNPAILGLLNTPGLDFVLLSMGGNEHNVLSMRQTTPRFDFVSRDEPEATVDPTAEIVPEAAIRETLANYMRENMRVLQAIRAASGLPMVLVEPPPPLPRAHVLAYPKEFFRTQLDQAGMSSDALRRKVWRVETRMLRAASVELGVAWLETPSDMFGADGLLKASACGQDASHANEAYGEVMIAAAARLMAGQIAGRA